MNPHRRPSYRTIQERLRQDALKSRNAYTYYRLCDMLSVKKIEDEELFKRGREVYDRILIGLKDIDGK